MNGPDVLKGTAEIIFGIFGLIIPRPKGVIE